MELENLWVKFISQEHDTEGKSNPAGGPMPDLLAAENSREGKAINYILMYQYLTSK